MHENLPTIGEPRKERQKTSSLPVRFVKFCVVGASGVIVDMAVIYLLADLRTMGLDITLSKVISAEAAIVNNFFWNNVWTFRDPGTAASALSKTTTRFLKFNAICALGLCLSVVVLHAAYHFFFRNIYLANLVAIALTTVGNFSMN